MGSLNKILLVLIILSGFLLIFYANNDIFTRPNLFSGRGGSLGLNSSLLMDSSQQQLLPDEDGEMADSPASAHHLHSANRTEFNLFVIYTKATVLLEKKYELLLKSLFKYTTIPLNLHVITDNKSASNAVKIAREQMLRYQRHAVITRLDLVDSVKKISDIAEVMMPYFSSHPGSYYGDALFYLSLGLHRIVDPKMRRGILIDCDIVFRSDVKYLFEQFRQFDGQLFGLAPELTPVYRHILYNYRLENPGTILGSPYYPHAGSYSSGRRPRRHGYPGFNSGVVLLDFDRIRGSKFYVENLDAEQVERLVQKYHFRGHLGDQDFYTLLGYEFPSLVYRLDCSFNRQLCTWWKDHGYSDIFDTYFHCEGRIRVYHGNCNTRIPE